MISQVVMSRGFKQAAASGLSILLAVALVAGCGGGGGSDAPPLSKAEFIGRADAICAKSERAKTRAVEAFLLRHHPGANGLLDTPEKEGLIKDASLPLTRDAIEKVGELGIPEGDEETVDTLLEETEEAIAKLEAEPLLFFNSKVNVYEKVQKKAKAYGFKSCILYL
jgi:hypothetical protein